VVAVLVSQAARVRAASRREAEENFMKRAKPDFATGDKK
jgi:hypothetical protein